MIAPLVELVCDGSTAFGYGHVRRMLTLADNLRAAGVTVRLLARSKAAQALLPAQPLVEGFAPIVIFDVPCNIDVQIIRAREAGQCVLALDYFGAEVPDIAIIVHPHSAVRARRVSFVGWQYQIIRADITDMPRGMAGEGVLVMLGGGDLLSQGHKAAQLLADQGLDVTLVQGPLAANCELSAHFEVLVDPPDLAERLSSCEWVVTNGGGCMFEAMCLGKPAVVLPQTEAEAALACVALEQGSLLGIGFEYLRPFSRHELEPVSRRAVELIDGRGAERVATIVKSLL
jgi:spore coat polysaccharide biosynthesis predicted glycosyltransferase SpsG